jgi:transposase
MPSPKRLDFTPEQIEALIERLNNECLEKTDYPLLAELLKAMVWMNVSLQEKQLSIQRLRSIFGIKTESAKKLLKVAQGQAAKGKTSGKNETERSSTDETPNDGDNATEEPDKKGHGHRPSSDYSHAKTFQIAHQTLKKGNICPSCSKGKLFNLSSGTVIRIVGQPWLQVEILRPERLRCPVCGKTFTAALPKEVATHARVDSAAKAIVSLLKYRGGVPFYRQQQIQQILGAPISASEIWEMTEDVADDLLPVYGVICHHAAAADLLQNDDTRACVLSIFQERKEKQGTEEEEKRTGCFTTGIIAHRQDLGVKMGLYFTGRKYAGENLDALLKNRPNELGIPIQQCDGGHNIPGDHETQVSNCLAHARRKFYELVDIWPKVIVKIIGLFSVVFANDRSAPLDPDERLKWHQERSRPAMEELRKYCEGLIEQKEAEPNSSLGKAIAYLRKHWEGLTLFLKIPGVPLTNNETERLIKRAVLNRKNAYFYRNETGAKIGDILMSMMETCVLNHVNPHNYLVAVQEHQKHVRQNPGGWLPWNFEQSLKELQPP